MKVSFYTLGCRVNQYETQMLKERFAGLGYEIAEDEQCADVCVVNTCTVTHLADRKSRQFVRRMKRENPDAVICVTGCYAQVGSSEVAEIEGVNLVVGTSDKGEIPELVDAYVKNRAAACEKAGCNPGNLHERKDVLVHVRPHEKGEEYIETGLVKSMEGKSRAYIKIQEGCNRFCSYCEIPFARGDVRSRQPADILSEAEALLESGFKEIVLTGINTALYGTEKSFKPSFEDERIARYRALWEESCDEEGACKYGTGLGLILAILNDIEGDFRIRIGSLEPTVVNLDDVLGLLKYDKLCHHLHLSMQSGSDNVLKMMNRHYTREDYMKIADVLHGFDKNYGITTDIIAGFPGESEEDFRDSLDIVGKVRFCKVHAFDYSKRIGTKASEMKGHIAPEVKKRRVKELIKIGDLAQKDFFRGCIGDERVVLVEEVNEDGLLAGYTDNYIRTYFRFGEIKKSESAKISGEPAGLIGEFVKVRLVDIYKDGMYGTCILS